MTKTAGSKVRFPARIDIRHLFEVRALLPLTPAVVIISAIASTSGITASLLIVWMAIHAVTLLVAGLTGWGFAALLRRSGVQRAGPLLVAVTGALVGAMKGVSTALVDLGLGLTDAEPSQLFIRGFGGVVVGVWLIGTVAYARSALEQLEQARDELVRSNLTRRLTEESAVIPPEITTSLFAVRGLRDQLQRTRNQTPAADIRSVVDATIRPLSRALWSVEQRRYPSLRLSSLYSLALTTMSPSGWLIGLIWAMTSFTGLVVPLGLIDAGVYTLSIGLVSASIFWLLARLAPRRPTVAFVAVIAGSSLSMVLGYLLSRLVYPELTPLIGPGLLVSGAVWIVFIALGTLVVRAILDLRGVIEADLDSHQTRQLIDSRVGASAEAFSTRRLATELHGSVQSRLLALARAVDQNRLTRDDLAGELDTVVASLEELAGLPAEQATAGGPEEGMSALENAWAGVIDLRIDPESREFLAAALSRQPDLIEVLREAVSNAFRHGHASAVSLAARETADGLILRIIDDGYGPTGGEKGLGSALFDLWTGGRWSLSGASGGGGETTLTISPNKLGPGHQV